MHQGKEERQRGEDGSNRYCYEKHSASMPHNGSRISGEPLLKSFGEGTQFAAEPHEPPASKAQRPQA